MSNNNQNWSLVIQRTGTTWTEIWLGNLSDGFNAELIASVSLLNQDQLVQQQTIATWAQPFRDYSRAQYQKIRVENLQPNKAYKIEVEVTTKGSTEIVATLAGVFTTLPSQLPKAGEKPFTIAFGSCFSNHDDNGQLSAAFKALYNQDASHKPDISFLIGDQVYLDTNLFALVPFKSFVRKRIAGIYASNWKAFAGVFTHGATWMLPDDHEYWNDYPFNELPILVLQAFKIPRVRDNWVSIANDAVDNIQSSKMFETIDIGNDLSICLVNTRSQRSAKYFLPPEYFNQLISWAENLRTPGVLVLPQNLFDKAHDIERNLLSYQEQYSALLLALSKSGKDIVVLSGDVHFGRVGQVELGESGATLTEIVSSPLANLSGLFDGIATCTANDEPPHFPPLDNPIDGIATRNLTYSRKVGSIKGRHFSQHPMDRTKEHFMTVGFTKLASGELQMEVQAWLVREVSQETGLPQPGFETAWTTVLKH